MTASSRKKKFSLTVALESGTAQSRGHLTHEDEVITHQWAAVRMNHVRNRNADVEFH